MRKPDVSRLNKRVSVFTAFAMLYNILFPTVSYALTGGPSQPEVQSFQPIGTSDMVDLFTGDFKYNVPLLDVEGYPINLIYASNITMDQEASWVGLGWNVNPGVVNRGVRGIPDDFKGESINKQTNMKKNKTIGVNAGAGLELFGSSKLKLGISYSMGLKWNNYEGWGAEQSLSLALSAGGNFKSPLSGGLGLNSSSDEGLTISPHVSFSGKLASTESHSASVGVTVGSSYNSRGGLKTLSISANIQVSQNHDTEISQHNTEAKAANDAAGHEVQQMIIQDETNNTGSMSKSFGARFDFTAPSYSPQITMSMKNFSASGNFKVGGELWGVHPNATIGGYYTSQSLQSTSQTNPAYGYLYAQNGTAANAVLDFNREKDGPYTESTPGLPLANFTSDIFSVSGQGTGGSYRPFRSDVGTVYDSESSSSSDGFSIGGELGLGNLGHIGVDITVNIANTHSGKWTSGNAAASLLSYKSSGADATYEPAYFKEANEKTVDNDPSFFQKIGGSEAVAVKLNAQSKFDVVATNQFRKNSGGTSTIPSVNQRTKREIRNQMFSYLTRKDVAAYGLENYTNIFEQNNSSYNHHIGEITTLGNDGKRYVYGLPIYNKHQEEISFAAHESSGQNTTGLVSYSGSDNSTGNSNGTDNFYSKLVTPPFAHAYELTAVLSADYVDNDNIKGPSDQDYGTWVKMSYDKIDNYKWRTPYDENMASINESLISQRKDDKGNIIYGEKELMYLKTIETKNYKAIFYTSARHDGKGVAGINGGIGSEGMLKLDKIELFNKRDMSQPIKTVHFVYDYSLCGDVKNNDGVVEMVNGVNINTSKGKLTLKKVFFTYENSNKGRFSPYEFEYSAQNPSYAEKRFDRWGNYKEFSDTQPIDPGPDAASNSISPEATPTEFPYVEQDRALADQYTQSWSLTKILLPSGGKIEVNYEADDYAYVQNKQANQMCKVISLTDDPASFTADGATASQDFSSSGDDKLVFKRLPGTNWNDYVSIGEMIYFKFLIDIRSGNHEYVPGYATVGSAGDIGTDYAYVTLNSVTLNDNGGDNVCPIAKSGIQYGRIYMKKLTFNDTAPDDAGFGVDLLNAILGASFIGNTVQAIKGINQSLWDQQVARQAIMNKSWIRLRNPDGHKLGGGSRVKSVLMNDNWNAMTASQENDQEYGQQYNYNLPDGRSSGVAAYEPLLGGDENPWKQPVFYEAKKLLAPDDRFYMEEPFGESFFPGASVGYSRVEVRNIPQQANLQRHGTGYTINEFYTSYDFPTITDRTTLEYKRGKSDPWSLSSIFSIDVKDYATVSQGYMIEVNDMNGKPKTITTYQENNVLLSKVTYRYKSTNYGANSKRLVNEGLTLINPDGTITTGSAASLGVFFDAVYDTREATSESMSPSVGVNLDFFYIPPFLFPFVPMIWPGFSNERTQFRSGVFTKVIQRFGILEETIAEDLGSKVSSKPIAYDSQTGDALVTQTITNYNDAKYTMNFPGYWYYKSMGMASRNNGVTLSSISFTSGLSNTIPNVDKYFTPGDEISISTYPGGVAWVTDVSGGKINVVAKNGNSITAAAGEVRVLRSGYRNVQSNTMASITLLSNPLTSFAGNSYQKILEASAIEYKNGWKTYCDCPGQDPNTQVSSNPYINGTRGVWRPSKSYAYLTGRQITDYDKNTNLRKDGVFTSFSPFYKTSGGGWAMDQQGWTYASEVTEFDPFGQEIENRDALDRYSAATYGYNQSLATSVSSNSRFRDVGVDNFEDYNMGNCADNHFKFKQNSLDIVSGKAHTGKKSIRVSANNPAIIERQIRECDYDPCAGLALGSTTPNPPPLFGKMYNISGGTPGVALEYTWVVVQGNPSFIISNNGRSITMTGYTVTTSYSAVITVRDPVTGCQISFTAEVII